ncbi:MAG: DM13 domain-containing protein, partial [Nitrososphaera sp.]|nr:DM13 domain-containing protein [Nitrososphaera sp.]
NLSGNFVGVDDGLHNAEGVAKVIPVGESRQVLRLEDFRATNGPDLYVYLSTDRQASDFVNLGRLKGNIGNQNYEIPAGTDLQKYSNVLIWCRAFSVLFGSAELSSDSQDPNQNTDTNGVAGDPISLAEANRKFALDFYKQITLSPENKDSNIFFSPWSISTAFALAYEGARQQTAEEIQSVFGFPEDNGIRRASFSAVQQDLNDNKGNYTLSTANAFWVKRGYQLSEDYVDAARNYYGSEVNNVDFPTEESRNQINKWVESMTNEKIKDLIPPGVLNDLTRLVITNAIYFKGTWVTQFDETDTTEEDFKVSDDRTVIVPMMKLDEAYFKYADTGELQALELPYHGDKFSMLILLPKNGIDLGLVEESLSPEMLSVLKDALLNQSVTVNIPKFKLETEYTLNGVLAGMGMPSAFDGTVADFSGITDAERLYIQAALHKAFVDVNEEGTEAAAATGIVIGTTSVRETPLFRADHPFIFVIQDSETDNILFMGRVIDPTL